jgi:hypothetical protein
MADRAGVPGRDAAYLDATAHEFDWRVAWEPDGSVLMFKDPWMLLALFDPDGVLLSGRATGSGGHVSELSLSEMVDALEHWGSRIG